MSDRIEEIRKRIAKRKKEKERRVQKKMIDFVEDEKYGNPIVVTYDEEEERLQHPLFRKEVFLFKWFIAALLFFGVAILFKNESPAWQGARSFVKHVMEQDFQFATVANWYEKQFGKPLAFFTTEKKQDVSSTQYALPASGRVLESFQDNGQGVMIETEMNATVEAISEGVVIFAGMKEGRGKTVIIQHADGSESWYGNLAAISVKLYDFIEAGKEVGKAMNHEGGMKGIFYLAIKQGDHFIDPIQVISFE
jgi:stage IV sporulation protein FA